MLLGPSFLGLLSIGRFLLFARETPGKTLELRLRFAVVARVGDSVSLRVSQEALKTHINTKLTARCNMLDFAGSSDAELAGVAIGAADNANPLDIFHGKGLDLLFLVSDQTQATNATAIGEGDMTACIVELPTSRLVFHASVIVLKLGIAFLPRLLFTAILIVPGDSEIGTVGTGLPSLRVETTGKGVFFCQDSAIGLQVVLRDVHPIDPQTYACVADELHNAYRFFNGSKLFLSAIKFVLVDQHASCSLLSDMVLLYTNILVHGKYGWDTCPKN